ncbi:hypothetical protein [Bacillus cereus]|uniref:hypothetical protein n=1 Tax=Bacillus cereus TaxID=1396 RepID=UPI003A8B4D20
MNIPINPLLENVTVGTDLYVVLSGYVGKSSDSSVIRLYSSLEMSHYIDIPLNGIISYDDSDGSTERTKIFVRGSTYINLGKVIPIKATEVFNGDDNSDDGGGVDQPVETGGSTYALLERFKMISHFKKIFKRYN